MALKKLPQNVLSTKSAVDNIAQMADFTSLKLVAGVVHCSFFYNMLDKAVIHSVVIYREVTGDKLSRKKYILNLTGDLATLKKKNGNEKEEWNEDETLTCRRRQRKKKT